MTLQTQTGVALFPVDPAKLPLSILQVRPRSGCAAQVQPDCLGLASRAAELSREGGRLSVIHSEQLVASGDSVFLAAEQARRAVSIAGPPL